jgi:pimeloyl-ACP methyl ester carboxylesterase
MPFAMNGDVRIHYVVKGSGPPLVLQHGFTGSLLDWKAFGFESVLCDHFQLILLDARGHGRSDKPHDAAAYGFEHYAADVLAVLDALGLPQAHYYGYSFGGVLGWALGALAPQRWVSLAIGGAHPYPRGEDAWARVARMREHLSLGMPAYVAWREAQVGTWPASFRERMLRNDAQALTAAATFTATQQAQGFESGLAGMSMPVLVLSGDDDELFAGSRARLAAATLSDGRYVQVSDADHFALYARSELVTPHLTDFLARVTSLPASV